MIIKKLAAAAVILAAFAFTASSYAMVKGHRPVEESAPRGLEPFDPPGLVCSPVTSLFWSWIDVDGSRRDEPHSGVDAGRLNDPIFAPADGVVVAVWHADWGWGHEGALMIRHDRADLGLSEGPAYYYSEFDHLRYGDIADIPVGKPVRRGERLARVFRPGGNPQYLPEVHWEVWSIEDDSATTWDTNEYGERAWSNPTGRLIDPLYLMSLNAPPREDGRVEIVPFEAGRDYSGYRGFTYILPCGPVPLPPRRP